MKICYFAWMREKMDMAEEELTLPTTIKTVADLMDFLKKRDEKGAHAFDDSSLLRVAVNQSFANFDHPLSDSDEVAFFPPVTGG